jgi:hypothetical protein
VKQKGWTDQEDRWRRRNRRERRAVTLLADLDAFLQEHRRCGELHAAVEGDRVDDVHVWRADRARRGS